MEHLDEMERQRRHTVRLLDIDTDGLPSYQCDHCSRIAPMRWIKGGAFGYSGWECCNCGMFFPEKSWTVKTGKLARRYSPAPKRSTYFDPGAWTKPAGEGYARQKAESPKTGEELEIEKAIEELWPS